MYALRSLVEECDPVVWGLCVRVTLAVLGVIHHEAEMAFGDLLAVSLLAFCVREDHDFLEGAR